MRTGGAASASIIPPVLATGALCRALAGVATVGSAGAAGVGAGAMTAVSSAAGVGSMGAAGAGGAAAAVAEESAGAAATGAAALPESPLKGAAASTVWADPLVTGASTANWVCASFTLMVLTGIGRMVSSAATGAGLAAAGVTLAGADALAEGLSASAAAAANFDAGQCCWGTDATS